MKVIIKNPGEPPRVTEWENMTEGMMELFDIATTALSSRNWVALCEDNGHAMKLEPNFQRVTDGHLIVGPVLFVGLYAYDFVGLTDEAIDDILSNKPYEFVPQGRVETKRTSRQETD